MKRLVLLAATLSLAGLGGAELISFQDPETGDGAYRAQVFEDYYSIYNQYQLDDLDLGGEGYYLESAVTYWFDGTVEPEYYRIRTYSELPDSYHVDQYFIKEYSGASGEYDEEGRWVVTFDLGGDVYTGVIWIAGYVRADYDNLRAGLWYNANAENLGYEPMGSEQYVWKWGKGHPPSRGHHWYLQTSDMSWKIEGTPVPEPGVIPLLVAVALSAAHLRRSRG